MIAARSPSNSSSRRRRAMTACAVLLGFLCSVLALEAFCRIFLQLYGDAWGRSKDDPRHCYRLSSNPTLGYELKPGRDWPITGHLWINKYCVRDESDDLASDRRRVALVGDSVTFGIWQSQEVTIASQAQGLLAGIGEPIKLLNVGVPGYGVAEVAENFLVKDAVYHFDDALYLLNLNDFARRNSVYEGGDNGLYRMYRPPVWHSLFLSRKAVYRLRKHGSLRASTEAFDRWYHWIFEGNRDFARARIEEMVVHARARGMRFAVLVLPVGSAFEPNGTYRLAGLVEQITEMLDELGVSHIDPSARFAHEPGDLINETEHLTPRGNQLLAEVVTAWINESQRTGISR